MGVLSKSSYDSSAEVQHFFGTGRDLYVLLALTSEILGRITGWAAGHVVREWSKVCCCGNSLQRIPYRERPHPLSGECLS